VRPGSLVLEDGRRFGGFIHGPAASGEVVFTTVMTGYPEVVTDPSYRDQIVVMCFPEIGIYGYERDVLESATAQVAGLVVRDYFDRHEGSGSIASYLERSGKTVLSGVDTRALVRHIRSCGTLIGRIDEGEGVPPGHGTSTEEMIIEVATSTPRTVAHGDTCRVVVVDYGVKADILRALTRLGAHVRLLPPTSTVADISAEDPDGVILSPGPGDPADLPGFAAEARKIAERWPTFGICLGHQLLASGFGGGTYKLKFGHRGGNHPVSEVETRRVYITSQNHGYAVDQDSIVKRGLAVTHLNANDGTVEGLSHRELAVRSLQYHPEAGPGPRDERPAFRRVLSDLGVLKGA